ncbi:hypothetical protein [Arthrobacter sp. GMC3]|uniref:hypothetical protein n=1 Tax=Arthrobacter sp. GMC3 TaxID=2058894 RepID=UPI0011B02C0A|nr:hypothetical protein [Arthrobacter sp. GMC3]
MNNRNSVLWSLVGSLVVSEFTLFAMLYVNGNFPAHIAISVAIALGVGVFASMRRSRRPNGKRTTPTR